ncbi:hypothetical protein G5B37_07870 [Rasiella rasia]|uniref:Uncharacterized protein n=1 Tax=Rasiella rasia TaxID=2744027 RepID=A0A6G6GP44_9FLAO|nr:DUF6252 family protein [Rasiella rasia]QIE59481.1 hypothetical protein G5B37_07870 [Rasiella rasia]
MKKFLLLLSLACTFVACEDIQDNSPAFQANLDDVLYRALDTRTTVADDGSTAIVGATTDQNISLLLAALQTGTFELNIGNGHQAIYEDAEGQIYSTENGGSGVVNITSRGSSGGNDFLSGNFTFTAILPGIDTVTVSRGLLYQVPVVSGVIEDPEDPSLDGAFVAEIDGNLFDPSTVVAATTDTSITISGALGDDTIQLIIPLTSASGTQTIPGEGFNAIYFISGAEEPAVSGTITIFEHDMTAQSISGTFNFATENHQISLGQFNVDY